MPHKGLPTCKVCHYFSEWLPLTISARRARIKCRICGLETTTTSVEGLAKLRKTSALLAAIKILAPKHGKCQCGALNPDVDGPVHPAPVNLIRLGGHNWICPECRGWFTPVVVKQGANDDR